MAGPGPKVQFPPVLVDKVKEPDSAACKMKSEEPAMLQVWLIKSNASLQHPLPCLMRAPPWGKLQQAKQQVSHHMEGTPRTAQDDLLELGKKRPELLSRKEGPLLVPENGLLSNTWKSTVWGETGADRARDFTG